LESYRSVVNLLDPDAIGSRHITLFLGYHLTQVNRSIQNPENYQFKVNGRKLDQTGMVDCRPFDFDSISGLEILCFMAYL
jgi:hypothetical protein